MPRMEMTYRNEISLRSNRIVECAPKRKADFPVPNVPGFISFLQQIFVAMQTIYQCYN